MAGMRTSKGKTISDREKLPTLVLKRQDDGFVLESSSPCVFAYRNIVVVKTKKNVDPCEFCGFVVGRKDDIRHHAKRHAPDSEYVVFFFFCFSLSFCLDMQQEIILPLGRVQIYYPKIKLRNTLSWYVHFYQLNASFFSF